MNAIAKTRPMTVEEFFAWEPGDGLDYQLIEGEPRPMSPTLTIHGVVVSELTWLILNHIRQGGLPYRIASQPGVIPRIRPNINFRKPDIAVFHRAASVRERFVIPVLTVEVLSPSNEDDTWSNVAMYQSMSDTREILVLRTDRIEASLFRRDPAGSWPDPEVIAAGDLSLESLGFVTSIDLIYADTDLAR